MSDNTTGFVNTLFENEAALNDYGGADFFNGYIYNHYGFCTVYKDLSLIRSMVDKVLTANKYKYEHLYNTTVLEYELAHPIERKTTEQHTGTDQNTNNNSRVVTPTGAERTTHKTTDDTTTEQYSTTYDSQTANLTDREDVSYNNYDETTYTNRQTSTTDNGGGSFIHGHTITTTHQYYREPQSEIQSERQIAMFSLQMTIINDILDAVTIPVYIDYDKTYSMPY